MKHYAVDGHLDIHNNREFPEADMRLLRRYNFDTCAIVGNSGSPLRSAFGKPSTGDGLLPPRGGAGGEASAWAGREGLTEGGCCICWPARVPGGP